MAAPTYGHDLVDITLAESTSGWSAWGGGGAGLSASPDLSIQGTNCVDKQITNAEKGQFYDNGSGIALGADEHLFTWLFMATPGLLDTLANRGLMAVIGSTTNAYVKFHLTGSDVFDFSEVAKCWAVRYVNTALAGVRTLVGSPGTNPRVFGGGASTTQSVKGANLGVDAIRRGTGFYITGGDGTTPATFTGAAAINDTNANRLGILQAIPGGTQLQGRFVVGQNSSKTPTAAHFDDSGSSVVFIDTPHSLSNFTQIIVDHASTVFNLTNYSIKALGTNNPGRLVFNNAATVAALTSVAIEAIGITTLRAGVTATSCTWRGTDAITQNGATLTDCLVDSNTAAAALVADDPGLVTGTKFVSAGTGHAIEITTPGTYSLTDLVFEGYATADGSTGNEVIYNNSGGAVTLNVAGGSGVVSVRDGAGASTTVNLAQVTLSLTSIQPNSEVRIYEDDLTPGILGLTELSGVEDNGAGTTYAYAYSYTTDTQAVIQVLKAGYEEWQLTVTLGNTDQSVQVQQVVEENI